MNAVNAEIEAREGAKGVSRYEVLGMVALPNLVPIGSEILNGYLERIAVVFGW